MPAFIVDTYVLDVLMRDLVGHDRAPSAFVVFLYFWTKTFGDGKKSVPASLQAISAATGLSKSAVQAGVKTLLRRQLIRVEKRSPTSVPEYRISRHWARRRSK